jgi:hypothetical protein
MTWTVDIPSDGKDDWTEIAACDTRAEAIRVAQELYGADDDGNICLVTGPHGVNSSEEA